MSFFKEMDSKYNTYYTNNTSGFSLRFTNSKGITSVPAPWNQITTKSTVTVKLAIKKVIFNDPATIVYWEDGTKTVVKVQNGEPFDKEKGFSMAVLKKIMGNQGNYFNEVKRWTKNGETD